MSNTNATEGNVESPSTYGDEGYRNYRKKEKQKQKEGEISKPSNE
ncbi:MAG: hypothetical protein WA364_10780 [Candidatus Nitrosopolaris sp.]